MLTEWDENQKDESAVYLITFKSGNTTISIQVDSIYLKDYNNKFYVCHSMIAKEWSVTKDVYSQIVKLVRSGTRSEIVK